MPKVIETWDGPVSVPSNPMDLQGEQWVRPREGANADDLARARRDQVAASAPAAAVAWSLVETLGLRVQPILFAEDEPNAVWRGPIFGSSAESVEYFSRWPAHGCGVASGQQAPDWGLLAVWVRDAAAWRRFIIDHGTIEKVNPAGSRERTRREYLELGQPAVVHWVPVETGPPWTTPKSFPVTRDAEVDSSARLALLSSITHPSETWIVYAYAGRASWRARELAFGVELRASSEPIPIEATLAGYRLATAGSLMRPETSSAAWLPGWLASAMKVRLS